MQLPVAKRCRQALDHGMSLDPTLSPKNGYRQIAATLGQEIRNGLWKVGDKLPTELALVDRFGVSRNTVREALRELEDLGFLTKRRGSRSEILDPQPSPGFVSSVRSIEDLFDFARLAHADLLSADRVILLPEHAARIGAAAGSEWLRVQSLLRSAPGRPPFCYCETYVAPSFGPISEDLPAEEIHAAIEKRYGPIVARVVQQIEAVAASDAIALRLRLAGGVPMARARSSFETGDGETVQILLAHFAPGRHRLRWSLGRRRSA